MTNVVRGFERFENDALNFIIVAGVALGAYIAYETYEKGKKLKEDIEGSVKQVWTEVKEFPGKIADEAKSEINEDLARLSGQFYELKTIEQNQEDRSAKAVGKEAYKRTLEALLAPGLAFSSLVHDTLTGEITWPGYVIRGVGDEITGTEENAERFWRQLTNAELTEKDIETEYPFSPDLFSNPRPDLGGYTPAGTGRKGISGTSTIYTPLLK